MTTREPVNIQVAMLGKLQDEISVDYFISNSKGVMATPTVLLSLVRKQLSAGVAIFVFIKSDGTFRRAIGTTKVELIPEAFRTGASTATNPAATKTNYYDLQSLAWKSFGNDSVAAVIIF